MNHTELVVLENLLTFLYAGVCCLGTGLCNSLSFYVKLSDVKVNDEGGLEAKFTPLPQLGYISSVEGITWRICQQKQQTTLEKSPKTLPIIPTQLT